MNVILAAGLRWIAQCADQSTVPAARGGGEQRADRVDRLLRTDLRTMRASEPPVFAPNERLRMVATLRTRGSSRCR